MPLRRAMRKRPAKPRRRMNMRRGRKAVGRARMKRHSDYARCVEIQETPMVAVTDAGGENVGGLINFTLADFQRPQEVAHAYKYYRAAKVEVTFIPYFNIAQTGGAAASRIPQLYYSVDRVSNVWIAPTESECLERGITPKIFNRKYKLTFKPNLVQGVSLETNQPGDGGNNPLGMTTAGFQNSIALFDKWLPTQQSFGYSANPATGPTQIGLQLAPNGVNPYALRYHGALFVPSIEGQAPATQVACGDLQLKITWEFKAPRALKTNAPQPEPNPFGLLTSSQPTGRHPNTQPTEYP